MTALHRDGTGASYFDENHDVRELVFETPFTVSGKARGSVEAQCKRKTIVTLEEGLSFPYLKKRLRVVAQRELVMEPIDVAIEEMEAKVSSLINVVRSQDMVMLQMQVQGIVSMQVNAGPTEFASVFLSKTKASQPPEKVAALQMLFAEMLHLVDEALHINDRLISDDQQEYVAASCTCMHVWFSFV